MYIYTFCPTFFFFFWQGGNCMSCLYILEIGPFLVTSFADIFSQTINTSPGSMSSHKQKNKVGPLPLPLYKINSKWLKRNQNFKTHRKKTWK